MIGYIIPVLTFIVGISPLYASTDKARDEAKTELIERVIKIEGSLEKPRVMFIVPKARLWKSDITGKSFEEEFLEPLYPEDKDFEKKE